MMLVNMLQLCAISWISEIFEVMTYIWSDCSLEGPGG
jgi:hypothetical protein